MHSKVNSLTVSGKIVICAVLDSINIIMVRLIKRNPVSQTGKPGSRDGNSIHSNPLLIFVSGHKRSRSSNAFEIVTKSSRRCSTKKLKVAEFSV
jgi:hypothetical protein